ncbi:MAG: PilX N-terminal domain-containing pilus assembly protein [Planctomycetota bacterium]|jgi:hypothetical protein
MIKGAEDGLKIHRNEEGIALVTSLLILLSLTLIGVTATTNTAIDTRISGNDFRSHQRFYASEGAVDFAMASLPALIDGNVTDPSGTPIISMNDLLNYAENNNSDITPLLNQLYNVADVNISFFNPDPASFSLVVHLRDNDAGNPNENNNLRVDQDGIVILTAKLSVWNGQTRSPATNETELEVTRIVLDHGGVVNLINPDLSVNVTMDDDINKIDGDPIAGISTTDELISITMGASDNINSVVANHSVKPSLADMSLVRDMLVNGLTPHLEGGDSTTPIVIDNVVMNNLGIDPNDPHTILYLRGYFELIDNYNGTIVIEDYKSPSGDFSIGLMVTSHAEVKGLIMLLPVDRGSVSDCSNADVEIKVLEQAKIDGVVFASSQPNGGDINLSMTNKSSITYDASVLQNTGVIGKFVPVQWSYMP